MPWIDVPPDDEWEGALGEYRAEVVDHVHDRVDNILAIHSLDLASMRAHQALYAQAMKGTKSLRKVEREMVALTVSKANKCHY